MYDFRVQSNYIWGTWPDSSLEGQSWGFLEIRDGNMESNDKEKFWR